MWSVKDGSPHSLLDQRITTGLGNDQVSPLHDYDGNEEGRVAGIFEDLALGVGLERDMAEVRL